MVENNGPVLFLVSLTFACMESSTIEPVWMVLLGPIVLISSQNIVSANIPRACLQFAGYSVFRNLVYRKLHHLDHSSCVPHYFFQIIQVVHTFLGIGAGSLRIWLIDRSTRQYLGSIVHPVNVGVWSLWISGNQRCVDILLKTAIRKRALLRKDCFGMTPLHAAAACGRTVCVSVALELLKEKDFGISDSLSRFAMS